MKNFASLRSLLLAVVAVPLCFASPRPLAAQAQQPAEPGPRCDLSAPASYPTAAISNGQVHALVYLPDAKTGYYRGSRFD
jgi:hypothetical protein